MMTKKNKDKMMAKKNKDVIKAKNKKITVKSKNKKDKINPPKSKDVVNDKSTLKTNKDHNLLQEKLQKQVDKLIEQSKQSEKETAKLLTALESNFDEKLRKLHAEFDLRIESLIATQRSLSSPVKKITSKQPVKKTKVPTKKPTIASLKGVGPVTQKKLAEAGFTTLKQIATPPASKAAALEQFKKLPSFNTWQSQATALLDLNK